MLQALIQEQNQIMVSWQRIWGGGLLNSPSCHRPHAIARPHKQLCVVRTPHVSGCVRLFALAGHPQLTDMLPGVKHVYAAAGTAQAGA
jgi:hypothetical protein